MGEDSEDLSWILEDMDADDLLDIEDELNEKEEEMITNLPPYCFTIDPKDGNIVRLNRGKTGYQPLNSTTAEHVLMLQRAYLLDDLDNTQAKLVVRNGMNEEIGVTEQQHDAMLHGSHFGFDNPDVYKILKGGIS